jgi:fatty acid desaturase
VAERTDSAQTETRRRRPDLFTLIAGLATLFVSSYVLTDGAVWWPSIDPRWLLTGGAVLVGVFLLASSLRGGRRRR